MIFVKYGHCILSAQYDIMVMQFTAIKMYKMVEHEMKKKWFGKMAFIISFGNSTGTDTYISPIHAINTIINSTVSG